MAVVVPDLSELNSLVSPQEAAKQGFPQVRRVSVLHGTDHTGEESLYVTIAYPDSTSDDQLAWGQVKPLTEWVWQSLWDATQGELYPYITVARESEIMEKLR